MAEQTNGGDLTITGRTAQHICTSCCRRVSVDRQGKAREAAGNTGDVVQRVCVSPAAVTACRALWSTA